MENVRMGIIGVGNMGSGHAKNITAGNIPGMVLTAIADISQARRDWAKENLPESVAIFSDAEEMMDSGLVDSIIVATPHYDHPVYVIKALNKGLNAISEKPAGVFTKAVREMNAVADASDKVFAIMFNQRTNCLYRKMREILQSGVLGEIKRTNWLITDWYRSQSYYDSGAWRATWSGEGGGVLMNQCPHNLDLWQWICGMPSKVRAFCHEGKWHNIEVEDDVTAYVEYPNGATGVFITSTGDMPGTNRFEVLCDGGKLVCEKDKLWMYKLEVGEKEFSATYKGGFGQPKYEVTEVETDGENLQHTGVLRAFTDTVLNGAPLVARGVEGINGLTIANAMQLSSWTGETVEIPLDEERYLAELKKKIAGSKAKTVEERTFSTEGTY